MTLIKPSLFSTERIVILSILLFISLFFGVLIFPKLFTLYLETSQSIEIRNIIVQIGSFIGLAWIVGTIVVLFSFFSKKVEITDHLVTFFSLNLLGRWNSSIVSIKDIEKIICRVQKSFNGKVVVSIVWLVFQNREGHLQEVSVSGWDRKSLKMILEMIKSINPKIKIDTPFYRDSGLELSGLDEYLSNKK